MTKQLMSLGARRDRIQEIATIRYKSNDDAAMEYLAAIDSATLEKQQTLLGLIISTHGVRHQTQNQGKLENSISEGEWTSIADRIADMVRGWSKAVILNNASLENTACTLWDKLLSLKDKDRIVALGILLDLNVVPYAQLETNLTTVRPNDVYVDAHNRILTKIATLRRVKNADEVTCLELAVAMVKIMETIESQDERVAFLFDFVDTASNASHRFSSADFLVGVLGRFFHSGSHNDDSKKHDD